MYVGPMRTVRGDKTLDANCCLYVVVQRLIPPDRAPRDGSTSPCRGLVSVAREPVGILAPAAAKGFHQEDRRGELLAMHLHRQPLVAEQNLLRRDHFEIGVHAALVSIGGDVECVLSALHAGIRLGDGTTER